VADLAAIAASLGEVLRRSGIPATPERQARFSASFLAIDPGSLDELYWIGRVTLLSDHGQVEIYDKVFDQVFRGILDFNEYLRESHKPAPSKSKESGESQPASPNTGERKDGNDSAGTSATPGDVADEGESDEEPVLLAAVSEDEVLRERDFAQCSQDELNLIAALVAKLPLIPPRRASRRSKRSNHGHELDMRSTIRKSRSTGGDPIVLEMKQKKERPRRVVLIADVSGSMEPYARVYMHLMRGAVLALHAEAFVFATRLTRLTRFIGQGKPDEAYKRVAENTPDWSGGTRIGKALLTFVSDHGQRGVARGAVVVIVSDGWEIDDPIYIEQAMSRLSRLAHHIIWVNPRKASQNYEPLVRGMSAALPYVDTFVSGHSLRAIQEVLNAIHQAKNATSTKRIAA
jgi:hypothetical protein